MRTATSLTEAFCDPGCRLSLASRLQSRAAPTRDPSPWWFFISAKRLAGHTNVGTPAIPMSERCLP